MKLVSLVIFALFVCALTQDCNNPLLDKFGFQKLTTPESGAGFPFCSNLNSPEATTCCSRDTVAGFQTMLDDLIAQLQDAAGQRDLYLNQIENSYYILFQSTVNELRENFNENVLNTLTTGSETLATEIQNQIALFQDLSVALASLHSDFLATLRNYQRSRVSCFTNILKVQASAWCLACDPDYATIGVNSNGDISYSPGLCGSITDACFPFLSSSSGFNVLIKARAVADRVSGLLGYVRTVQETSAIPAEPLTNDIFIPTESSQKTVAVPTDCNEESCSWQCQNLIPNGVINTEVVAYGAGAIGGDELTLPDITLNPPSRLLQDNGSWEPNLEGTGLNFDSVVADPARVTNMEGDGGAPEIVGEEGGSSSSHRLVVGGGIMAFIVLVVTMI